MGIYTIVLNQFLVHREGSVELDSKLSVVTLSTVMREVTGT